MSFLGPLNRMKFHSMEWNEHSSWMDIPTHEALPNSRIRIERWNSDSIPAYQMWPKEFLKENPSLTQSFLFLKISYYHQGIHPLVNLLKGRIFLTNILIKINKVITHWSLIDYQEISNRFIEGSKSLINHSQIHQWNWVLNIT